MRTHTAVVCKGVCVTGTRSVRVPECVYAYRVDCMLHSMCVCMIVHEVYQSTLFFMGTVTARLLLQGTFSILHIYRHQHMCHSSHDQSRQAEAAGVGVATARQSLPVPIAAGRWSSVALVIRARLPHQLPEAPLFTPAAAASFSRDMILISAREGAGPRGHLPLACLSVRYLSLMLLSDVPYPHSQLGGAGLPSSFLIIIFYSAFHFSFHGVRPLSAPRCQFKACPTQRPTDVK